VAFAAALSADAASADDAQAAANAGSTADDKPPADAADEAGTLLEDAASDRNVVETHAGDAGVDEELTDQALEDEESWLAAVTP
jgi:hypothetical protein